MLEASSLFADENESTLRLRHIAGVSRSVERYLTLKIAASILQRVSNPTAS